MKVKCIKCQYEREHLGEYEDYQCPICNAILNEDKQDFLTNNNLKEYIDHSKKIIYTPTPLENETVGLDGVIRLHIIASFKKDIQNIGEKKTWEVIEGLSNAKTRLKYRKFYFLALEELKKEV